MNITRYLDILKAVQKKTVFLFGPRQTGKSWLIRHVFKEHKVYNLLESETFLKLNHSPQRLREECIANKAKIVVIDEIQRIPELLNEVHLLIEEHGINFLLTGSSARKLRRGGVNLLGGRANLKHLYPFSFCELQKHFNLKKAINFGLLPSIYFSDDPNADLHSYVGTYLKEEIAAEGLTRNVPAFSRFLEVAALCNGKIINYTKISNDAQVARSTVQEYFQILKDTLIAHELAPWMQTVKRKPISTSKFYLFDTGVIKILQNRNTYEIGTSEFGEAFETFIFHELKSFVDYNQLEGFCYWRSISGFEVDFILNNNTAIEVKCSKNISYGDLKNLKVLREEKKLKNYFLVCLEKEPRIVDGIKILPCEMFLEQLWNKEYI